MVQCELCGSETAAPKSIKVEGAELDVCGNCAGLGTQVKSSTSSSTTTKYSTDSSSTSSTPSSSRSRSTGSSGSSGGRHRGSDDIFDSLGDLAQDYDALIREARENRGMSQTELADELNEKRSLISKLERGETLPSDAMQSKLERYLEIDLSGGSVEETEWQSEGEGRGYTLGEIAERKD